MPIYNSLNSIGLSIDSLATFFDLPKNSMFVLPLSTNDGKKLFDRGLIPTSTSGVLIVCTTWKAFAQFINAIESYTSICGNFDQKTNWTSWIER